MEYQDKSLACRDCNAAFIFTASEQHFFHVKGLANEPRRCPHCRVVTRAARQGKPIEPVVVKCDECGIDTTVTFKPTGRKPVLCLQCLHLQREEVEQVAAAEAR